MYNLRPLNYLFTCCIDMGSLVKVLFKQHGVIFILLSMLTGLMGAFVNPLMSLFIVEGLQTPPIYLGGLYGVGNHYGFSYQSVAGWHG